MVFISLNIPLIAGVYLFKNIFYRIRNTSSKNCWGTWCKIKANEQLEGSDCIQAQEDEPSDYRLTVAILSERQIDLQNLQKATALTM